MDIQRMTVGPRMSQGVLWNGLYISSAQVAGDLDLDVAGQTVQVLETIDRLLREVGLDKTRILAVAIWLADIADYAAMNGVWDSWISKDHPPARACVAAQFSSPRIKVEMQIQAAFEKGSLQK